MEQYITALERAAATSHYTGSNRFDSFAPIRLNVAAQWLVDGVSFFFRQHVFMRVKPTGQRDYFWNLSRAILLAKESVYIHDWWLTPGRLISMLERTRTLMFNPQNSSCDDQIRIATG